MGDFGDINDPEGPLQRRLAAHLRRVYVKNGYSTGADMAEKTGINQGQVSAIMNGRRSMGLETLLKLWSASRESLDYIVGVDPPAEWFRPGPPLSKWDREQHRAREPEHPPARQPIASPPSSASSSPRPTRRAKRGGAA